VVCAYVEEFWMGGDGGQRPFVCSGRRHSHHCQRLQRKELVVVAATYLMRPVEAVRNVLGSRLGCSVLRHAKIRRRGNV
jgi:hypothetical protein